MSFLFGKPKPSPKDQMREWTNGLKKEKRLLEREIEKIKREEQKLKNEIKKEAKANHTVATKTLAKAFVKSKGTREKLLLATTQISSVILQLKTSSATMNVAGVMEKSSVVMSAMSKLVKVKEVREVAKAMAKEMMKAGVVEEILDDAMGMQDSEDIETEADEEINKVVSEILSGQLSGEDKLKEREKEKEQKEKEKEEDDEEDEKQIDEMKLRLSQLET